MTKKFNIIKADEFLEGTTQSGECGRTGAKGPIACCRKNQKFRGEN